MPSTPCRLAGLSCLPNEEDHYGRSTCSRKEGSENKRAESSRQKSSADSTAKSGWQESSPNQEASSGCPESGRDSPAQARAERFRSIRSDSARPGDAGNKCTGYDSMVSRNSDAAVLDHELKEENSHDPSGPRIRCPLCRWSPRKEDHWSCTCGHQWNTFDTGGVCPACLHQWIDTQCLSCRRWSPHSDWYARN
jgi:hypothetical protein